MWEKMTARIEEMGGEVRLQTPVTKIELDGERVKAIHADGEVIEPKAVISSLPLRDTVPHGRPGRAPRDVRQGRRRAALPRLPHRRARPRRRGPVPGQLDLHPRARRRGRPHPELPLLEPLDGPRPGHRLRGHGVLLLPGRPPVEHGRRGPRRAGHARARAARPRQARPGQARLRRARAARVPDVRRELRRAGREDPRVARPDPGPRPRSAATACTATTTPTTRC